MDIEEARKVYWLKSNHRPLGELLDEGFLTKDRLEWAAAWAYSPKLKQAAKTILESLNQLPAPKTEIELQIPESNPKKTGIEIDISLDKARSTLWPVGPYKGQAMGALVDSRQLSLKDLGYAAEQAWEEKVRQAARALLLVRLEQVVAEPEPSAGPIHVISGGRSYSQRRESLLIFFQGILFSLIIVFAVYFGSKSFSRSPNPNAMSLSDIIVKPGGILALVIVLASVIALGWFVNFAMNRLTKRLEDRLEQYRAGQEGEDAVVQSIAQTLDGNWHLFRNVNLPGRNKGDLDLILVGQPGVWTLEVKNFRGEYRNIGERWEYKHGKDWKNASVNPSRQAENNAYRLKNFLKADNVNLFVNTIIVWVYQDKPLIIENPSVAVWQFNRLNDELGNIWQGEKLVKAEQDKVIQKLTKLCEQQKKNEHSK